MKATEINQGVNRPHGAPDRVLYVDPQTCLEDALIVMSDNGIHHLPVLLNGDVVGLLTETDILAAFVPSRVSDAPVRLVVGQYMRSPVPTIDEGTELSAAVELMLKNHLTALPVVNGGKLAGIVTQSDMLRLLHELLRRRASVGDVVNRGELLFTDPMVQSVLKVLSDMGI